jgi:hypothetical protein
MNVFFQNKINNLYSEIRDFFTKGEGAENVYSIFLCGSKQPNPRSLRDKIQFSIQSKKSKYTYQVYYPEKIFVELVYGHRKRDLLSLENILAECVHSVAILVESPGTIAELGAFANHALLSNKMIVIVESKFKSAKSFISLGPIRHLGKNTKSKIFYIDYHEKNVELIAKEICDYTREISKDFPIKNAIFNPIVLTKILLGVIYAFDPVTKDFILNLINRNESPNADLVDIVEAILDLLHTEGLVYTSQGRLSTTAFGSAELLNVRGTKNVSERLARFLHGKRLQSLNLLLRKQSQSL